MATESNIQASQTLDSNQYEFGSKPPVIEVYHLTKRILTGSQPLTILDDISFSVHEGESLAIVGASGSGKSTLLSILSGLDTPSSGKVSIQGRLLFDMSEDERALLRAQTVGVVFQTFQLLPMLTALENVMLPLEISNVGNAKSLSRAMLERVGLGARLSHYPNQLSGGEQQRVALARAFVTKPKILFADEPTGSLDAENGRNVIDLMFGLREEYDTTLVLVTHDMTLAYRCEGVLLLEEGGINFLHENEPTDYVTIRTL